MREIKLLLAFCIVILATAGCGNVKVTQTLHPCTNLDQPGPFESVERIEGSLLFDDNRTVVAFNSDSSKELVTFERSGSMERIVGMNPSGEWFGYLDYPSRSDPPTLHLISYRGEQRIIPVDPHPGGGPLWPILWVSDETILMVGEGIPAALLEAFSGSWLLEPVNSLPNRYRDRYIGVAFSPDLSRALYVFDSGDESYVPLTLWDFEERKVVWRADESFGIYTFLNSVSLGITSWSPDSSAVALTLEKIKDYPSELLHKERMYLVDTETGELHEFRTEAEDNWARTFTWSPDGRYIAIVNGLLTDPDRPGIIIYDLESDVAIDLCPMRKLGQREYDQADGNLHTPGLAWSPDSRYLVFGQGKDPLSEDNRISMVDIYTGKVTVLREGSRIRFIGWSPFDWTEP